jgi:hypothetical protein
VGAGVVVVSVVVELQAPKEATKLIASSNSTVFKRIFKILTI